MPEAAEVAVAATQLDAVARGRTLLAVLVTHERTVRHTDPAAVAALAGRAVLGVRSHGKWIVVDLDGTGIALGIHLRMSGQLLVAEPGTPHPDRHVHAILHLAPLDISSLGQATADPGTKHPLGEGELEVRFRDPRTFGELRALPGGRPPGADDLFDPTVTGSRLHDLAARRRAAVKAVLLDQQRTVAGVGSYLADEALHRAGISPVVPADQLARSAWDRILDAARTIARDSQAAGGVTLADEGWVDLEGRPGGYAEQLRVHARPTCATCGANTRAAVVGGRSARWCPRCQPARRRR
ncbi:MAG TPA: DNA-formamidopyrimidine glycosylase family protein [Acidimicrobiales bacterium]|nr:DNA-formamidopyrimidine glycosylase family protein [Acidimicrobiales bacterium]